MRIVEHLIHLRQEWNHQTDVILVRKVCQRFEVASVCRTEDDIHILHFISVQDRLDGIGRSFGVISIKIDGNTLTFQTVNGNEQSFVIFHHTGLFVCIGLGSGHERQHYRSLDGLYLFEFR